MFRYQLHMRVGGQWVPAHTHPITWDTLLELVGVLQRLAKPIPLHVTLAGGMVPDQAGQGPGNVGQPQPPQEAA